jgi:hypothetical protein
MDRGRNSSRVTSGGWRESGLAATVVLLAMAGAPAIAGGNGGLIACDAARPDVSSVSLEDLRYGIADTYAWATATVHVLMRDQTVRSYSLNGRADPIAKPLPPNEQSVAFAYPGFACHIQFPAITSVSNCHGGGRRRTCEIGIRMFGKPMSYAVSLTAQRMAVREAALP